MSWVFVILVLASIVYSFFGGNTEQLGNQIINSGKATVDLAMMLTGIFMVFVGLLRVAQDSGILAALSRVLKPVCVFLIGKEAKDEKIAQEISTNLTANLLGLGNAATPCGIKAMHLLDQKNPTSKLTKGMCMFLLVNASCLQLVPTTVIALRAAAGSAQPTAIFLPCLLGSAAATATAVVLGKLYKGG